VQLSSDVSTNVDLMKVALGRFGFDKGLSHLSCKMSEIFVGTTDFLMQLCSAQLISLLFHHIDDKSERNGLKPWDHGEMGSQSSQLNQLQEVSARGLDMLKLMGYVLEWNRRQGRKTWYLGFQAYTDSLQV